MGEGGCSREDRRLRGESPSRLRRDSCAVPRGLLSPAVAVAAAAAEAAVAAARPAQLPATTFSNLWCWISGPIVQARMGARLTSRRSC